MAVTYRGIPPETFIRREQAQIRQVINEVLADLEAKLVSASPVGVAARLKGGWVFKPILEKGDSATIGQTQSYFLPVELGRRPGAGIGPKGRESVALWARRKLGLSKQEAMSLAFGLSKKYEREGRPAAGFAGLAIPGSRPTTGQPDNLEPVTGGLIAQAFEALDRRLNLMGAG